MKGGFDLGTTNSVVSFFDRESNSLTCFRQQAGNNSYVPTMIHYGRVTEIGEAARAEAGSPDFYSHFKLLLGSAFDKPMPGKTKTPHEAARDYIGSLLKECKDAGQELDKIVMTIPEAWYREKSNMTARDHIMEIYRELKFDHVQFQSEPVAAAAYYCWRHQQENSGAYKGKLLVIDYGGGTLDVTLCDVRNGMRIRVLDSCGFGEEQGTGGCGGSAFDREVVNLICREKNVVLSPEEMETAYGEFEQKLIAKTNICTELMSDYFEYPDGMAEEELFTLKCLGDEPVRCRHLWESFERVNRPVLERAVRKMKEEHDLSGAQVRVVLVGGFSNFCCVETMARKLLDSRTGVEDPRFDHILSRENRALAVAKGAALIAEEIVMVDPVFPYELGFIMGEVDTEYRYHDCYIPLIEKGGLVDGFAEPVYSGEKAQVMLSGASELYIRLYTGGEKDRIIFALDESVREIFPICEKGNEFEIGLAVDPNMIPELYIRNVEGQTKHKSLNQLLEKIVLRKK